MKPLRNARAAKARGTATKKKTEVDFFDLKITFPRNGQIVPVAVTVTPAGVTKSMCSQGLAIPSADGDRLADVQGKIYLPDADGVDGSPADPTNEAGTTEGAFDPNSNMWFFNADNDTLIPGVIASNAPAGPYPANKLVVWCEFTPADGSAAYWVKGLVQTFFAKDAASAPCAAIPMAAARKRVGHKYTRAARKPPPKG